jgi:hypothetical protein
MYRISGNLPYEFYVIGLFVFATYQVFAMRKHPPYMRIGFIISIIGSYLFVIYGLLLIIGVVKTFPTYIFLLFIAIIFIALIAHCISVYKFGTVVEKWELTEGLRKMLLGFLLLILFLVSIFTYQYFTQTGWFSN